VSFTRYAFNWEPNAFDRVQLENYILELSQEYVVIPFTHELGLKALESDFTADFCMFFKSVEAFMKEGLGYAIVKEDAIIAGASSYSACLGAIDITIGTLPEYRRQGLALACASKLILDCLDRGIYPRWDAANLNSVALAKKLGYTYKAEYTVYTIK
jgi:GNAT superfamily N-acetyltransferase